MEAVPETLCQVWRTKAFKYSEGEIVLNEY
ncbi:DUF2977 domain-containing protein, partial [Staphylococcus aureus]